MTCGTAFTTGPITTLASELVCEPLIVGPGAEPGLCHWMSRTSQSHRRNSGCQAERHCGKRLHVGFLCQRWGVQPSLGGTVAGRADWDRGVPMTIGKVAISLQSPGAAG